MGVLRAGFHGTVGQPSAQVIDGSLKFDSSKNQFLKQTFSSDGNKRTFTYSFWAKKTLISQSGGIIFSGDTNVDGNNFEFRDNADKLRIYSYQNDTSEGSVDYRTTAEYRDTNGWKHFVLSIDSTNGTASDRMKLYINGERVTSFSTASGTWGDGAAYKVNTAGENHYIGLLLNSAGVQSTWFDGQMSQFHFIDGQALGPEHFAFTDPLTGTWRPKKYTGSFSTPTNQTETWSTKTEVIYTEGSNYNPANVYDANTGNFQQLTGTYGTMTLTHNFGTSITDLKIDWYFQSSNTVIRFNGDSNTDINPSSSTMTRHLDTISTPASVTSISFIADGAADVWIYGIYVNGELLIDNGLTVNSNNSFYLPMDGNSPIGEDKSGIVTPNNGSIWSNSLTSSSGFRSSEPKTNAFDGNTSSICSAVGSGTITFTSPVTFASNSTIRVFLHGGDHTVTVNGGDDQTISSGSFRTVTYSNPGNATFTMTFHRGGGADTGVRAIEINGVILTDGQIGNNLTPVNFGGSNSIEKATGALPILNTTQGGTQAGVGNFGSNVSKVIAVTVSNASGSNKYYFDSVLNPTLPLIRGSIISFDTSDSSNNLHPFKLSSTNADSSGGTEYTDGVAYFVNGSQKNASDYVSQYSSHSSGFRGIKWTVPHDVSTTYYYCTSHTGMGNNGRLNSTTDVTKADPFAWKCFLALPLNDPSKDQSSALNRTSSGKAITVSGCVPSSDQTNFYGLSTFFDGSNDQLSVEAHGQMAFGADDDWTFELWFYTTTVSSSWAISDYSGNNSGTGDPGGQIYFSASSGAGLHWYQNSTRLAEIPKEEIKANKWHHLAFVKDGTADTITSFLDGVRKTTSPLDDTSGSSTGGLIIGQQGGGTFFSGYMSDFRVYKGIKKYTTNFIPASTDPDILPDTPSGVSGSSKLTKITEGAVAFDGTGDYLSLADSADFDLAGNNWTIEAFVYHSDANYASYEGIVGQWVDNSGTARTWILETVGSGATSDLEFYYYDTSNNFVGPVQGGTLSKNRWHHVAACRSGNTIRMFVDGLMYGGSGTSISVDIKNATNDLTVGGNVAGAGYWNGFISNVRVINNTALYTANFTPPSAPLTNVTNTKLLCCQSNIQAGSAAVAPNISGINDGREWSHFTSASGGFNSSYPKYNLFDGEVSPRAEAASNDVPIDIDFSPALTVSSTISIHSGKSSTSYQINNSGSYTTYSDAVDSYKDISFSGTLTNLKIKHGQSGQAAGANAIKIDGTVLTDAISVAGDAAATNFNPFNTDINIVRGQETGYPTWNPLRVSSQTLSNNNMTTTGASGNVLGSMFTPTSGKFYWEVTAGSDYTMTGIQRENNYDMSYPGNSTGQIAMYLNTGVGSGQLYNGGSITSSWGGGVTGDVIGVALDMDNNKVYFYNNGRGLGAGGFTGTPEAVDVPTGGGYTANCRSGSGAYDGPSTINFGQKPFKFPPPDGFQPLNTANVRPETVIARPDQYVGITTWKGDDQASHVINDLNFDGVPDFVWIKRRDGNAAPHQLYDTVRGATKPLQSSASSSEDTQTSGLKAFVRNGFELGASSTVNGLDGDNGNVPFNYLAWTWKAGGNKGVFNVDDVGYANASDVNMNIGGQNSSFYNTSETWSNGLSALSGSSLTNPPNGFNGDPDNYADSTNGWSLDLSGHTFGSGSHPIEVKSGGATSFSVGGATGSGSLTDPGGGGAKVWTGTYMGEINTITSSASGASVYYVKIDGKILVNSGTDLSGVTQYPSITATGCSVGTKQGFSIIKATGSNSGNTIAHGLGKVPKFVISKDMDNSRAWYIYHGSLGANYRASFNDVTFTSDTGYFGSGMTDTLVTLKSGGSGGNNYNGANMIYYIWADVPGLQKFGKYTGNNTSAPNGPFVELGFRPALVVIKRVGTGNWIVYDNKRDTFNPLNGRLYWNTGSANVDNSGYNIDFLSNGFRITGGTNDNYNASSDYVYAAWAEAPTVNLYGGQSNAR